MTCTLMWGIGPWGTCAHFNWNKLIDYNFLLEEIAVPADQQRIHEATSDREGING